MRNRSIALVVRDMKILSVQTYRRDKYINELPGGGIEQGETPEEAAVRELKEECGLDGTVVRPLNIIHRPNGSREYIFLVDVPQEQHEQVGSDPEIGANGVQAIRNVYWLSLEEFTERERAFLWSYGLMDVEGFFDKIVAWGDEISYPMGENAYVKGEKSKAEADGAEGNPA